MPKKFSPEFNRDVVTVARRGDLTGAEVAADFDISVESVNRWMPPVDLELDFTPQPTTKTPPRRHD